MKYEGDRFSKRSQVINCRNPFIMDRSCLDYDQTSEDEWQELHCEDLENEDLLAEEENSEMNNDDPDLRREGFIVPDDYYSGSSQNSIEPDDYESDHEKKRSDMNKELLKRAFESQQRQISSNYISRPYIHTYENNYECLAYKVKALPRKVYHSLMDEERESINGSKFKEVTS